MLNFNFSEKGLQLVSLSHFVYDFSRKIKTKTKNLKSQDETKYRENEKSFWGEIKSIFHHFKRAFSCQKLSQNWECVFNIRMEYAFTFQYWYCKLCVENPWGGVSFVNFCSLAVLYNGRWMIVGGVKKCL